MPSRLASVSSLPTGASVGIIHASSRGKKQRGEEAESHHPWPRGRNANSVSLPGELDPFVATNECDRTRPAVDPALSDRASSRVTASSASTNNDDAGSSNESSGYAMFVPRAIVARTAERSGGGDGHDGSCGGGDSGGLATAFEKLTVHEPGRSSSRVRGRNGKNAAETTRASGGDSGSEDEDEDYRKNDSFRPSRRPKKGDFGRPVPGSKQLEVEWGLDEAFSMAMAGLRGGHPATEIAARGSVPTAAGRREYTDRGRPHGYGVSRKGFRENSDDAGEGSVNEGGTASNASGGDEWQRARGAPNEKQTHSASSPLLGRNRNRPNGDRDAGGAAGGKEGVAVAARSSERKRGVGAGEEGIRRPRGEVKSSPSQEQSGESKAQRVRRSKAEDDRESVNRSRRRSPGNCQQREGRAADSRDRGVEIGSSGVWEHVTGEGAARCVYKIILRPYRIICIAVCTLRAIPPPHVYCFSQLRMR